MPTLGRRHNAPRHIDPGTIEEASAATRAAVLDDLDAFNAHDTDRLIAGFYQDVVWSTGSDVFRGISQLRRDVFDEGLWVMRPSLAVRTLLVEGEAAAGTFHEALTVSDGLREFDIAVFFTVRDEVIPTVQVFREGSADIEP